MLSQETLRELQTILKTQYGLNLPSKEVFEVGQNLVSFFDHLAQFEFTDAQNGSTG